MAIAVNIKKVKPSYIFSLVFSAVLLFTLGVKLCIYPFGDKTMVYSDGSQYLSIIGYFVNSFFSKSDLIYSWSNVAGGNMTAAYAYYASSPFNFLMILFRNNLLAGLHLMICIKLVLTSIFMTKLLNLIDGSEQIMISILSVSYAFMGYTASYAWNPSWMDGVLYLPLILCGIINIVRIDKYSLYIFSLGIAVISNFYIGFMLCIASVLMFVSVMVIEYAAFYKEVFYKLIKYGISSVLAGSLGSFLLLPAYYNLPQNRKRGFFELLSMEMSFSCRPSDLLSMVFTYPLNNMSYAENLPIIFVGILPFLLSVAFFLCNHVSRRKKVVYGVLVCAAFLSFTNSTLNLIWHGNTQNAGFNYRNSFLFSFLIVIMAYEAVLCINEKLKEGILRAAAVVGAIAIVVVDKNRVNIEACTLLLDSFLVICFTASLCVLTYYKRYQLAAYVVMFLIAGLNMFNITYNCLRTMDSSVQNTSASQYIEMVDEYDQVKHVINDPEFYRIGKSAEAWGFDAMLFDYAGLENYASTEDVDKLEYLKKLGMEHIWMWGRYNDNMPVSADSLLGIKYLCSNYTFKSDYYDKIGQTKRGIYRNEHALPLIFEVERRCSVNDNENSFERLNRYWNSVCSKGKNIYYKIAYENKLVQNSGKAYNSICFCAVDSNPVYIYLPDGANSMESDVGVPIAFNPYQCIYYLGTFTKGENVNLKIEAGNGFALDGICIYSEDVDSLKAKTAAKQHVFEIEERLSSVLSAKIQSDKALMISSSIPYDVSWHVMIDGNEVSIKPNMDAFLSFDCPSGIHEIVLRYVPKGLAVGRVVSFISLFLFFSVIAYENAFVYKKNNINFTVK